MSKKESANLYKISVSNYALRGNWGSEEDPFVLHKALKTAFKFLESTVQKASTTGKWRKAEPGDKQTGTWWTNMTVLMRSISLLLCTLFRGSAREIGWTILFSNKTHLGESWTWVRKQNKTSVCPAEFSRNNFYLLYLLTIFKILKVLDFLNALKYI